MPSVCSGSELAEELEELEELDEEELDELAELEAGELLGWLVEFEGAGAPPPPPQSHMNFGIRSKIPLQLSKLVSYRRTKALGNVQIFAANDITHKITPFLFYQSIAGEVWDLLSLL